MPRAAAHHNAGRGDLGAVAVGVGDGDEGDWLRGGDWCCRFRRRRRRRKKMGHIWSTPPRMARGGLDYRRRARIARGGVQAAMAARAAQLTAVRQGASTE